MSADQDDANDSIPCVVITSCGSKFKEEELVRQILGTSFLPEPIKREDAVAWYPWTINNKYYTANVGLCVVPSPFNMNSEVAQSMQAFIAYFDSKTKDGLSGVSPWLTVVDDIAPEVLILVCDRVCENGVSRHEAQQWCLSHAFELVELNPQELPDEDDDFPESTGVKRIVQALNANVWSSVEMKDGHNQGFGLMSSLVASRHNNPRPTPETQTSQSQSNNIDENTEGQKTENCHQSTHEADSVVDPMTDMDIQELANLTAGDADVENFERLFTKLKEMKGEKAYMKKKNVKQNDYKASSLPHEQRKVHAEKVAKAFWMAIGGDQDEIDGLSSGEES